MDEVKMLVSAVVANGDKKLVRVSFVRGNCIADGLLPDGIIEKFQGFTPDEAEQLERYLRANRQDILQRAKEINPLRSWLMS